MTLAEDVRTLRNYGDQPATPEIIETLERVLEFLDPIVLSQFKFDYVDPVWGLPRGYNFEFNGSYDSLCVPRDFLDGYSQESISRKFLSDIATGWLEELAAVVDPDSAELMRTELEL